MPRDTNSQLASHWPAARLSLAHYRAERPGYANRRARRHRRDLRIITQLATSAMRSYARGTRVGGELRTHEARRWRMQEAA